VANNNIFASVLDPQIHMVRLNWKTTVVFPFFTFVSKDFKGSSPKGQATSHSSNSTPSKATCKWKHFSWVYSCYIRYSHALLTRALHWISKISM